jgi:hypothetical protein
MGTTEVLQHLGITADEWAQYARSRDERDEKLTPEELRKFKLVQRVAVFGVGHELDEKGNPIENSMSYAHNAIHLHWIRKEEMDKQTALKDLLASVKPMP